MKHHPHRSASRPLLLHRIVHPTWHVYSRPASRAVGMNLGSRTVTSLPADGVRRFLEAAALEAHQQSGAYCGQTPDAYQEQ